MWSVKFCFCITFLILSYIPEYCDLLVIPEDVPMGLAAIYGFTPRFLKGKDHRVGFGFRLGNHADFQVLYELGPQHSTKPLQSVKIRSASYRQRDRRRRPFIELLLRAGILKELHHDVTTQEEHADKRLKNHPLFETVINSDQLFRV